MLIPKTDEEIEIWINRKQLIFMLKQNNKNHSTYYLDEIVNMVFDLTEDELNERYALYSAEIQSEQWIDCYPMYFHITEFEEALKFQLRFDYSNVHDKFIQKKLDEVNDFYKRIKKCNIDEMTLEEKEEFFW